MGLLLFFQEELKGLLVWGSGSLVQNSWSGVSYLLPRLLAAAVLAAVLVRPLAVLELDDASARSLGVSLQHLRFAGLGLAVFVTACVVSVVGLIGFIGLAAPAMVRLLGIRQLGQRLLWAPILGALLLAATDLLLQSLSRFWPVLIPTGAMTAMLGAPLLLWLIPRLGIKSGAPKANAALLVTRHSAPARLIGLLLVGLLLAMVASLLFGQGMTGWSWPSWLRWQAQLEWRLPRTLAAGAAGVLLALAGTLLQRVSNNPMASPELLGVSGGTFMGAIATALLLPALPLPLMLAGGLLGAFGCLLLLVVVNRKHGFQPERILLSGIAITALFEPLQAIALANGDMRVQQLLSWMSGSTYYVTLPVAYGLVGLALLMLAASLLVSRWLESVADGECNGDRAGHSPQPRPARHPAAGGRAHRQRHPGGGAALVRRSVGATHGQADGAGAGPLAPARCGGMRGPADGIGGLGRPADPLPAGGTCRAGLHPVRGRLLHVVSASPLGVRTKTHKKPGRTRAFCCLPNRLTCRCRSWRRCGPADRRS